VGGFPGVCEFRRFCYYQVKCVLKPHFSWKYSNLVNFGMTGRDDSLLSKNAW